MLSLPNEIFNQERYICLYKYHWGGSFFLQQTLEYNSQSSLASKQDPITVYVNGWQVVLYLLAW